MSFWLCPSEKANQGFLCLWLGNKQGNAGAERCLACSSPAVMTGSAWQPCHCGWLSVLSFQLTVLARSWVISGLLQGFVAAGRFGFKRKALPPSEKMVLVSINPELWCLFFAVPMQSYFFPYFILKNPCCLYHCQLAVLFIPKL